MLRLTQEADNALRIMFLLARAGEKTDAPTLARRAGIAPQFALKILRKLKERGLVSAALGVRGGYSIALPPDQITVLGVVETIDGPLYINRCLEEGFVCSRMGVHTDRCAVNRLLLRVNQSVAAQLGAVTLAELLENDSLLSVNDEPSSPCDLNTDNKK